MGGMRDATDTANCVLSRMTAQRAVATSRNGAPGFGPAGWMLALAVLAAPRLAVIAFGGAHAEGDSRVYLTVATNLFDHGCISMADPAAGTCVPHWGGNQLPGYPTFIAAVWAVFGRAVEPVLVGQTVVFAAAAAYLADVLRRSGLAAGAVWTVICMLAVSPSLVGWSRSLLTETMSVAAAVLLLAELVRSIHEGRLRTLSIGTVLTVGVFVRYDFILVAVPVVMSAFMLHRPAEALRRGFVIALVIAVPLVAWTARSVMQGLPPMPPFGLTPEGEPLPQGMLLWTGTWIDDQYDLPASVWALVHYDYRSFRPPFDAYADAIERARVEALLEELRAGHVGQAPPQEIDRAFAAISDAKRAEAPLEHYVLLPLRRAARMWLSAYPSMGWPAEVPDARRTELSHWIDDGFAGAIQLLRHMPLVAGMKAAVAVHRYYAHPNDLCQLIQQCAAARPINSAFDVYTRAPVSKFDLLQRLADAYALRWEIDADPALARKATAKPSYYSLDHSAKKIGYRPTRTAIEAVIEELEYILAPTPNLDDAP